VAKLADALDLGSSGLITRVGSSPIIRTTPHLMYLDLTAQAWRCAVARFFAGFGVSKPACVFFGNFASTWS
jgi:hypothetical protein